MLPLRDNVPTRQFPLVTVGLIGACFVVWFWELHARASQVDHYSYYVCSLSGPCVGTEAQHHLPWWEGTFTAMFLHASWSHILGNMLFLWIFGNNVEDALGRGRYLLFYLASGYVATLGQSAVTLHWAGVDAASVPNLGASGAIAGVLGAYFVLLPRASVLTLVGFFFIPLRASVVLGIWFLLQLWEGGFSLTQPSSGGGVAFFAHVSGFAFGALAARPLEVRAPLEPSW